MVVMGVDLSLSSTGVVVIDKGKYIPQSYGYSLKKTASKSEQTKRLLDISSFINAVVTKHNVKIVGIEQATFGGRVRSLELMALTTVVQTQLYLRHKIVPIMLPVSMIRKFLLGDNKCICVTKACTCKKKRVETFFNNRGVFLSNYDEYDAAAVGEVLNAHFNGKKRSDAYGLSVHEKIEGQVRSAK